LLFWQHSKPTISAIPIRINAAGLRYAAFILLALTINVVDRALTRSIAHPGTRMLVAVGGTFDVVVLVSAIYYWLLVRPGIRHRGSLIAIVLLDVLHATYFYPNAPAARVVVAWLCEVGLIGFMAVQVRRRTAAAGRGVTLLTQYGRF
jgi:hypothetical protein